MDPLSVIAGVGGILAAAAQLIQGLNQLGSAVKDAAADAQAAAAELANISIVVQGLQAYVLGRVQVSPQRLQLITVEHITATVTGCIFTCSDLDHTLKSLHIETGLRTWDKAKWFLKKDRVSELIQRLQGHKATFTMMLNIIQCSSMSQAESNMDQLCDKVNELLRSNEDLSLRLRNIESSQTVSVRMSSNAHIGTYPVAISRTPTLPQQRDSTVSSGTTSQPAPVGPDDDTTSYRSHFEEILHRTRVYRNVQSDSYEPSLVSDARSTLALSICSSLTLGEISNISVYALPVYSTELSNSSCYTIQSNVSGSVSDEMVPTGPLSVSSKTPSTATPRKDITSWFKDLKLSPRHRQQTQTTGISPGVDRVFGVPLTISIRYANVAISLFNDEGRPYIYGYIPIIIGKCGVFLKVKATDTEYIFEQGGSPTKIKEAQTAFDSPPRYGKGISWYDFSVHDAANIFVRYLTVLPEPVIPFKFHDKFCDPLRDQDASSLSSSDLSTTIKTYQDLIAELPPLHSQLLLYILDLLAVFASKSDINKMTTAKLAAIFQPGILAHPDCTFLHERRLSQDVLIFLVDNQDNFLIGMTVSREQSR